MCQKAGLVFEGAFEGAFGASRWTADQIDLREFR